jgi:hypothetical protein
MGLVGVSLTGGVLCCAWGLLSLSLGRHYFNAAGSLLSKQISSGGTSITTGSDVTTTPTSTCTTSSVPSVMSHATGTGPGRRGGSDGARVMGKGGSGVSSGSGGQLQCHQQYSSSSHHQYHQVLERWDEEGGGGGHIGSGHPVTASHPPTYPATATKP